MAAIVPFLEGEVASLLGSSLGRGFLGSLAGFGASQIIGATVRDLAAGGTRGATASKHVPRFAIVDLHTDKIVRTLSTRKVYSILTHPSRRGRRSSIRAKTVFVPAGSEVVTVR